MRFLLLIMPEKGWYSLTVRLGTAKMIRGLAKDKKLSVDELLNNLISSFDNKKWLTCILCGAKVKASNMSKHMDRKHPK